MQDYQAADDLLKDRVILVTGAGDGIGRAAALAYAGHGATVILLGKTVAKLETVYDEIEAAGGPEAAIYPLNLESATYAEYQTLAETVDREFGRLDGLLHNAAFLGTLCPMAHYEPEMWYRTMQINLNAPFLLTQTCLGLLQAADDPALLFTSDENKRKQAAYWGAYGVSKAALDSLMRILADEHETAGHIRVNAIDPGNVRTRMFTVAYPGIDPNTLPTPEAVMPAYLYAMGPDCKEHGSILKAQAE